MKYDVEVDSHKYEQNFVGSSKELKEFFRNIEFELFSDKLLVEGQNVIIPEDKLLNIKLKFDIDDNYSFAIKVIWKREDIINNYMEESDED
jgi:hypothetical protein